MKARSARNAIGIRLPRQAKGRVRGRRLSPQAKRIIIDSRRRFVARIRENLVRLPPGIKRNRSLWRGLASRAGLTREKLDRIFGLRFKKGRGVAALEEMHIIENTGLEPSPVKNIFILTAEARRILNAANRPR